MNKNLLNIALAFAALGDLSSPIDRNSKTSINDIDFTPKKAPLPKGCQYYYFDVLGDCINWDNGQYEFKCVAINEKSARKKFERWLKSKVAV